eukprot:CAMPEP_0170281284 /NCGR_PEP_ID=MMETSP0116_2-20130129/40661_1 /TAXON_ID=400756 /ORGANISM="Durinskia baltica, Strain CSIRO CS-38" /LENGTH=142 /DNA_ID=CAMNT_0010532625 /DNA_START=301 /DNA_END=726 /DNA_ORIENTATION=+
MCLIRSCSVPGPPSAARSAKPAMTSKPFATVSHDSSRKARKACLRINDDIGIGFAHRVVAVEPREDVRDISRSAGRDRLDLIERVPLFAGGLAQARRRTETLQEALQKLEDFELVRIETTDGARAPASSCRRGSRRMDVELW